MSNATPSTENTSPCTIGVFMVCRDHFNCAVSCAIPHPITLLNEHHCVNVVVLKVCHAQVHVNWLPRTTNCHPLQSPAVHTCMNGAGLAC